MALVSLTSSVSSASSSAVSLTVSALIPHPPSSSLVRAILMASPASRYARRTSASARVRCSVCSDCSTFSRLAEVRSISVRRRLRSLRYATARVGCRRLWATTARDWAASACSDRWSIRRSSVDAVDCSRKMARWTSSTAASALAAPRWGRRATTSPSELSTAHPALTIPRRSSSKSAEDSPETSSHSAWRSADSSAVAAAAPANDAEAAAAERQNSANECGPLSKRYRSLASGPSNSLVAMAAAWSKSSRPHSTMIPT
mmetsp:Transcript_14377/g.41334  ORF Transcript_14377/g.41334 Transcript_14377/m.41334 type:complete len:259 (-) Transcript_14377:1169-1945(-)